MKDTPLAAAEAESDQRRVTRCEVTLLDEDGLVEIRHGLGTMDVRVVLHATDGTILTLRMMTPIDQDTCEGILDVQPAYAMVTRAEDEPEVPVQAATARDREVTLKGADVEVRTGPLSWS